MNILRIILTGACLCTLIYAQEAPATIQIAGDVKTPMTVTAEDLSRLPRATVKTKNDGVEVVYEGVWLWEVLKHAGAPMGSDLRGKALASYLLAEAKDGYQVVYSLAELDPAFSEGEVLLADKANGKPLFGEMGTFRLVSKDKRGARSVRMLTKLEVVQLRK